MNDSALLERYVCDGSQTAFAELVQRYLDLVYTAALRHVQDSHLAKDVAQNVFICLAGKAHRLRREQVLVGWLFRATHLEAMKLVRDRTRRSQREAVVAQAGDESADASLEWDAIAPMLDEAMN